MLNSLHLEFLRNSVNFLKHFDLMNCCCSVTKLYPTPCNSVDCSTPDFPVLHYYLPEFDQTHVHPTISSSVALFSSCPQSFPASGSFPMSQLFASASQSIGALASILVLPMNQFSSVQFSCSVMSNS